MSFESFIEWTQRTWNFLIGCTKKSKGCMNCYAIRVAWRLMHNPNPKIAARYAGTVAKDSSGKLNWTGRINFDDEVLMHPLSWREPSQIFVNSLSDPFHENVRQEWRDRMCAVMALCPQHTFQILTKEPEAALRYFSDPETPLRIGEACIADHDRMMTGDPLCASDDFTYLPWPLPNVWLGTSVENQDEADKRIPYLLRTPAAVRFISAEPLLGSLDLMPWLRLSRFRENITRLMDEAAVAAPIPRHLRWNGQEPPCLHWVIVGGESGPDARPMHPEWAMNLRDQCVKAGVPFFFKQWGEFASYTYGMLDADEIMKHPHCTLDIDGKLLNDLDDDRKASLMVRVGKKNAGRTLDGRTWDEMPAKQSINNSEV
jgi:protein gp37